MASAFQKVRATTNAMVGLFERFDVLAMPAFGEQHTLPTPAAVANVFAQVCLATHGWPLLAQRFAHS